MPAGATAPAAFAFTDPDIRDPSGPDEPCLGALGVLRRTGGLSLDANLRLLHICRRDWRPIVGFEEAVRTCFAKYLDFEGDASRPEFWWFFLFVGAVSFALAIVSNKLSGLFSLAMFVPLLAVTVRRLHDANRSGWWLLSWFIPLVGWIILVFLLVQEGDQPHSIEDATR